MGEQRMIMITIGADGKAALKEMGEVDQGGKRLSSTMADIAIPAASIASVYALGAAVKMVVTESLQFLGQMETSTLGIATSFMTGGKYIDEITGKVLVGADALAAAQSDSMTTMAQLQVANMQTIATLDRLVEAYQVALPIAMAKGFDRQQVLDFTVAVVQAAGAIGVPMHQLGQELRALLTGDSWQDARIGQVLGLRPADINQMKGDAEGLFSMLMQKLDAYKIAGGAVAETWDGLWSNAKDIAKQAGGQAFEPLFEAVKVQLMEITTHLVTIDDRTKQIRWNEDFVSGIDSVRSGITAVVAETYRISMLIDLAGGSMTHFGLVALKTAEILTRFVTIGQFGDSLKAGAENMSRWNKVYEERYKESERALQALADREVGLQKLAEKTGAIYKQNPAGTDDEATRKATERKARNARELSMIFATMRERDLAIGKSADAKELLQLDLKHQQEIKRLKDAKASKAQLEEAARLQKRERDNLVADQEYERNQDEARVNAEVAEERLRLQREEALSAARIAEQDYLARVQWLEKLDAYQLRTGAISEDAALRQRYDRERGALDLKQRTLAVEIAQEENDSKRNELEAEYVRITEEVRHSKELQLQDEEELNQRRLQAAWMHQATLTSIVSAGAEARLQFIGNEQGALDLHYAQQQQALAAKYQWELDNLSLSQDQKLAKEREYRQQSLLLQQEQAQKQAELWWDSHQKYLGFAQQMTTMGLQMLLFEENQRSQIGKRMLATSIRFLAQYLQQFMFNKAKEHLIGAASSVARNAQDVAAGEANMTMLEAQAVAWAAYYAAHSLNPFGGQAYWAAATAMSTVAGVTVPAAMTAIAGAGATAATAEFGMAAAWAAGGIAVGALGEAGASAIEGGTSGATTPAGYGAGSPASPVTTTPAFGSAESEPTQVINVHIYGIADGGYTDWDKLARDKIAPSVRRALNDGVR